ncbi:CD44 antigen isoform X8 [Physeter macrocephalus]|uniref:CD44 antigen n=1 Tax=Physeter macrocephalus TaxID=9755 RepID=A0A2Y9FS85_PHYMC|nr:CD44 antigen isoform X8 [Physeter catodon]|eukprot:XP_007129598.2 CD44 antigen isoform X6 [Physeter catodon]
MDTFWWRAAWGLCLVQLSLAQIDLNITCRYAGVFHVEKNGRYSISKTEAADLCKAFNCTLPTMAQMEAALLVGFETCRYGFIDGHVVIPRIHPNSICAANNTGVYILTSNTSQYDTYCFNASAPHEEDCTSVTDLPNTFEGPITITIVNRDGTRYTKKGEYRTNPDDINPSTAPEEDMSSGSSSERSTSGGYNIFHTHLPTVYPNPDQDSPWVSSNPETTPATITSTVHSNSHAASQEQNNWIWPSFGNSQPKTQDQTTTAMAALMSTSGTTSKTTTKRQEVQDWFSWWFQPSASKIHLHTTTIMAGTDSNIISAGWEPTEENEDESDRHPSYSGSGTDDDEDFISSTISTTPRVFNDPQQNQDWTQLSPGHSNPEVSLQTTTRMTDVDRSSTSAYGEKWTQETHSSLSHHGYHDEEETQHPTSTTRTPPTSTTEETATQKEQWFENGWPGEYPQMPKEDSHSTAGTTAASAHDSHPNQRVTMQSQEDRSWTYFFDPVSHPMGRGHQTERRMDMHTSRSTALQPSADPNTGLVEDLDRTGPPSVTTQDQDSSHEPSGRSYTTHGSESAGHSSGSQERGANTTSGPMRKPQIPEWLIILASLLALALILAVCIAVNSRRRCGQKKKLVINNGNGTVEERKPSGLNGEASKSQEMVHLVNKESSETPDQFVTADERRNLQNVDMKIGV